MAVEKNRTWKKGMRKQYNLPYNIEAVGKNIERGKDVGDGNFDEVYKDTKNWGLGRISSCRKLYTTLNGTFFK